MEVGLSGVSVEELKLEPVSVPRSRDNRPTGMHYRPRWSLSTPLISFSGYQLGPTKTSLS